MPPDTGRYSIPRMDGYRAFLPLQDLAMDHPRRTVLEDAIAKATDTSAVWQLLGHFSLPASTVLPKDIV